MVYETTINRLARQESGSVIKCFENVGFRSKQGQNRKNYNFGNAYFYADRIVFINEIKVETVKIPLKKLEFKIDWSSSGEYGSHKYFLDANIEYQHIFSINLTSRECGEEIIEIVNKISSNLIEERNARIGEIIQIINKRRDYLIEERNARINSLAQQGGSSLIKQFEDIGFTFKNPDVWEYKYGTLVFFNDRIEFLTETEVETVKMHIGQLKFEFENSGSYNKYKYKLIIRMGYDTPFKTTIFLNIPSRECADEIMDIIVGIKNNLIQEKNARVVHAKTVLSQQEEVNIIIGNFTNQYCTIMSGHDFDTMIYTKFDELYLLYDVIRNRFEFEDIDDVREVTDQLLKHAMIELKHREFAGTYGSYFSGGDIEEYFKDYINVDIFDPAHQENLISFTYYLQGEKILDSDKFSEKLEIVKESVQKLMRERKITQFEKVLLQKPEDKRKAQYTLNDIDMMTGSEFEGFVSIMLQKMGYSTGITPHSGDQGIDIIAERNGLRIGIQAKCYSGKVANSAIQEVVAGLRYYSLSKAIVITNSEFTSSAKKLAAANDVVLWDRNMLKEKIMELF